MVLRLALRRNNKALLLYQTRWKHIRKLSKNCSPFSRFRIPELDLTKRGQLSLSRKVTGADNQREALLGQLLSAPAPAPSAQPEGK